MEFWRPTRRGWSFLSGKIEFMVGKERKISFQIDGWCGREALTTSLSYLFVLSALRGAS